MGYTGHQGTCGNICNTYQDRRDQPNSGGGPSASVRNPVWSTNRAYASKVTVPLSMQKGATLTRRAGRSWWCVHGLQHESVVVFRRDRHGLYKKRDNHGARSVENIMGATSFVASSSSEPMTNLPPDTHTCGQWGPCHDQGAAERKQRGVHGPGPEAIAEHAAGAKRAGFRREAAAGGCGEVTISSSILSTTTTLRATHIVRKSTAQGNMYPAIGNKAMPWIKMAVHREPQHNAS